MLWNIRFGSGPAMVLSALALLGCGGDAPTGRRDPRAAVHVQTAVASAEEVRGTVEAVGSVEPWARVAPGTKILGRVEEVRVSRGERVRKGQLLARLETRDLVAAVNQARAAVTMAEASLDNARAQTRRIVDLHSRGSVTDKNLEDATAQHRMAEAAVEQARANLDAAEITLGYAEVRSPVPGWVTAKLVEAGDVVSPGEPLFQVEDLTRVKITVSVPESVVVGLEPGTPARVRIDVLDASWEARADRINPGGDPASRTYEVEVVLDNPDGRLKSGMFARTAFPGEAGAILRLPETAVVRRGQLTGVFVVGEDGVARLRWIRLGKNVEGRVEVLSGLDTGETFVVSPPPGLTDGTPVAGA